VCFDKRTGRVIWKSQDDVPGHAGPVWATIGGVRQLVIFTASALIGLDPSAGQLLWRVPIRTVYGRHVTTPVVVGDVIVVGSYTAGLVGVQVTRSASGWNAAAVWKDARLGMDFASPVAVKGHVYGIGPAGRLFCVDARTGSGGWVKDAFFSGLIDAGFASFLVAGSNLLVLAERGQMMVVPASTTECKVLSRTTVCGRNWCSPAYVGGKLYLRDKEELRCVQLAP
jgi:outer membrane protein assembly factor BamB